MQFVFRRDEEGVERIYVGDVCVARITPKGPEFVGATDQFPTTLAAAEAAFKNAIERADEAGFWATAVGGADIWIYSPVNSEVKVDVPVADNATLSVTTEEDES